MKPDYPAIPGDHAVGGAQRCTGKKHLSSFNTPALFVLGMNLLIPANGIFQPFFLRKTESRLDLRTDIGFTDSPLQVSHENHSGDLLDQSTIDRIGFRQLLFPLVFLIIW